ncbi:murein biosynthesis integral membrane protein MurJ [Alphaproteobacteria bacterium]|nr:murein biosynthesis integral membrane protein MurJ [Alphaproteobacteria bacterium]
MKDKNSFFIRGFTQSAIITFFSRISGFVRDVFIAAFLGAGISSDIFLIAFKLPNLFRRITAEGALTSSLLPIYSSLLKKKGKIFATKFLKIILTRISIFLFFLMIFFQIIMPFLVHVLAPGFTDNNLVIDQITILTRVTIIFMPLVSIVALLGVITNVSGRFWVLASTPIILNFVLIISCFFINNFWDIKSLPLALATVFGGLLQLVFILTVIKKYKILKPSKTKDNNLSVVDKNEIKIYLKKTWDKFLPAAFGGGITQINLLVDTIFASLLGFGSVSYLYFADRIAQLPLGIIGIALGTSLLTSLSKASAMNDQKQFSSELIISIKIGLFFSIPALFVFINFSELFISTLLQRGEFSLIETKKTAQALVAYSIGIPAFILLKSCQVAFLSEGNTKTPMYIGFALLFLNTILSFTLMHYFFHAGIALATSLSSWVGCIIYISILVRNRKITKSKNDPLNLFAVIIYAIKLILISILMILILKSVSYFFMFYDINQLLLLLILVLVGLVMYFLTTYILRYIPQDLLKITHLKLKKDD